MDQEARELVAILARENYQQVAKHFLINQELQERLAKTEQSLSKLTTQVAELEQAKKGLGDVALQAAGKALNWGIVGLAATCGAALSLSSTWKLTGDSAQQQGSSGWERLHGAPAWTIVAVMVMTVLSAPVFFAGQRFGDGKAETTADRFRGNELVAMEYWNGLVVGMWAFACIGLWMIAAVLVFLRLGGVVFDDSAAPGTFVGLASALVGAHIRVAGFARTMCEPEAALVADP